MKKSSFMSTLAIGAGISLFICSCNSGDKTASTSTADTTTKTMAPPPPPSKPANVMVIIHKVTNFAKWKPGYDGDDSTRQQHGLTNYVIGRGLEDSNMVLIALKMSDEAKAKEMATAPAMKEIMTKAGVVGAPTIEYIETVSSDTTNAQMPIRVRVTHKVKDWDTWKRVFDSTHQSRIDAGLIDRSIGHFMDDNHMVSVVCVVSDLAKAKAFMSSNQIKANMAKAGVEGPPTIFFYNVVQMY